MNLSQRDKPLCERFHILDADEFACTEDLVEIVAFTFRPSSRHGDAAKNFGARIRRSVCFHILRGDKNVRVKGRPDAFVNQDDDFGILPRSKLAYLKWMSASLFCPG